MKKLTPILPHEGALGLAILERDDYEVMLQSVAAAVAGFELLVSRRKTFYGAEEIFVREPGGNVVGFAQFGGGEGS